MDVDSILHKVTDKVQKMRILGDIVYDRRNAIGQIGDEYGMSTFLVKSSQVLYKIYKPQNIDIPEGKFIQELWEKYIPRMFTDEYLIFIIQQREEKEKNSVFGETGGTDKSLIWAELAPLCTWRRRKGACS